VSSPGGAAEAGRKKRAVGIELFERAAEARGRILRVEQLVPEGAGSNPACGAGYLLTFDVGRILVAPDAATGELRLTHVEQRGDVQGALLPLEEEEPWWRVVGNPITRAWQASGDAGTTASAGESSDVRIQFREDEENPKVISFRFEGGAVCVTTASRNER
jgi:hypothetical protein